MLATIDLRGRPLGARDLRALLPRAEYDVEAALSAVRPICDEVRDRGAEALHDFAERFDGVRPPSLRVPQEVLGRAQVRHALVEPPKVLAVRLDALRRREALGARSGQALAPSTPPSDART